MNSADAWTKLLVAVGGVLGALGVIVRAMVKRFPPKATGLAAEVASLRQDVAAARAETQACRADLRLLTDYVHDLREDYARDTSPPKAPRDWPEGLRL